LQTKSEVSMSRLSEVRAETVQTDKQTDRQRHTDRHTQTHRQAHTDTQTDEMKQITTATFVGNNKKNEKSKN